jgi:hypothetical protein
MTAAEDLDGQELIECSQVVGSPEAYSSRQSTAGLVGRRSLLITVTDETTAITAGTGKIAVRIPFAMTLTGIRASLTTASAATSPETLFTVDVNQAGSTILSTKLTFDAGEKTTTTAATPAVISDSTLDDDVEITVDVDDDGDGAATGLKVWLIGMEREP